MGTSRTNLKQYFKLIILIILIPLLNGHDLIPYTMGKGGTIFMIDKSLLDGSARDALAQTIANALKTDAEVVIETKPSYSKFEIDPGRNKPIQSNVFNSRPNNGQVNWQYLNKNKKKKTESEELYYSPADLSNFVTKIIPDTPTIYNIAQFDQLDETEESKFTTIDNFSNLKEDTVQATTIVESQVIDDEDHSLYVNTSPNDFVEATDLFNNNQESTIVFVTSPKDNFGDTSDKTPENINFETTNIKYIPETVVTHSIIDQSITLTNSKDDITMESEITPGHFTEPFANFDSDITVHNTKIDVDYIEQMINNLNEPTIVTNNNENLFTPTSLTNNRPYTNQPDFTQTGNINEQQETGLINEKDNRITTPNHEVDKAENDLSTINTPAETNAYISEEIANTDGQSTIFNDESQKETNFTKNDISQTTSDDIITDELFTDDEILVSTVEDISDTPTSVIKVSKVKPNKKRKPDNNDFLNILENSMNILDENGKKDMKIAAEMEKDQANLEEALNTIMDMFDNEEAAINTTEAMHVTSIPHNTIPDTTSPLTTIPVTTSPLTTIPVTTISFTTIPVTPDTIPVTTIETKNVEETSEENPGIINYFFSAVQNLINGNPNENTQPEKLEQKEIHDNTDIANDTPISADNLFYPSNSNVPNKSPISLNSAEGIYVGDTKVPLAKTESGESLKSWFKIDPIEIFDSGNSEVSGYKQPMLQTNNYKEQEKPNVVPNFNTIPISGDQSLSNSHRPIEQHPLDEFEPTLSSQLPKTSEISLEDVTKPDTRNVSNSSPITGHHSVSTSTSEVIVVAAEDLFGGGHHVPSISTVLTTPSTTVGTTVGTTSTSTSTTTSTFVDNHTESTAAGFFGAVLHSTTPDIFSKSTCRCGVRFENPKIVGGGITKIAKYPWLVGITTKVDGFVFCGGSIINDKYVLTAAHCVDRVPHELIYIRLGETSRLEKDAMTAEISKIITHPQYESVTDFDLALLQLTKPLTFSKNVLPICIPENTKRDFYGGKSALVAGWGKTKFNGNITNILNDVRVDVSTHKICNKEAKYPKKNIHRRIMCAASPGKDACQGDSGGPLVYEKKNYYEQIGIVSWGIGCAENGHPGIYTRITAYSNWIKSVTKDAKYCTGNVRIENPRPNTDTQTTKTKTKTKTETTIKSNVNLKNQNQPQIHPTHQKVIRVKPEITSTIPSKDSEDRFQLPTFINNKKRKKENSDKSNNKKQKNTDKNHKLEGNKQGTKVSPLFVLPVFKPRNKSKSKDKKRKNRTKNRKSKRQLRHDVALLDDLNENSDSQNEESIQDKKSDFMSIISEKQRNLGRTGRRNTYKNDEVNSNLETEKGIVGKEVVEEELESIKDIKETKTKNKNRNKPRFTLTRGLAQNRRNSAKQRRVSRKKHEEEEVPSSSQPIIDTEEDRSKF